jgi:hypothetical protein
MASAPQGEGLSGLARMTRKQATVLVVAAANIVLIMLFPPFDLYSVANSKVPVFAGFDFYFNRGQYMVVNAGVLSLELFVVMVNVSIAWLVGSAKRAPAARRRVSLQNATLILVALNLVVIILFPPFESVYAITKAQIPTFEGFYFIFARQANHVIVTTILYLEVFFVLINGALFWLIFREIKYATLAPAEALKIMTEARKRRG